MSDIAHAARGHLRIASGRKIQEAVKRFTFKTEVTISLGVAVYNGEVSQYQLILNADEALYRAKQKGKNLICVFE